MLTKVKLLLLMITVSFFFSACSEKQPEHTCATVVMPYVDKQTFEQFEVEYERVR